MQKWEYLQVVFHINNQGEIRFLATNGEYIPYFDKLTQFSYLNTLGTEGWELVNVYIGGRTEGQYSEIFYFKRLIAE